MALSAVESQIRPASRLSGTTPATPSRRRRDDIDQPRAVEIGYQELRDAKVAPVTRIAGQTSIIPLQPAKAQISQNGTSSEKNGSCRPIIPDNSIRSSPVTATARSPACPVRRRPPVQCSRSTTVPMPRAVRSRGRSAPPPVTATGVPKPAAPSKKAPNAKAISSSCSRRSAVMSDEDVLQHLE